MQKDYCKPRTGNTVVGEGAITTGSMLLPASQGQNGAGGGGSSFVGRSGPG